MNLKPKVPKIFDRIMRYAGKQRRQVRNPYISARECIELADYFVSLLESHMTPESVTIQQLLDEVQRYIALSRNARDNNTALNRKFCTEKEALLIEMDKVLRNTSVGSCPSVENIQPITSLCKLTSEQVLAEINHHMKKLSRDHLNPAEIAARTGVINSLNAVFVNLRHYQHLGLV